MLLLQGRNIGFAEAILAEKYYLGVVRGDPGIPATFRGLGIKGTDWISRLAGKTWVISHAHM